MILLGLVLFIVGLLVAALHVLVPIGGVILLVGLVLAVLHYTGRGRLYY